MTDTSSILAADFGSVHTRVLLIDVVDGMYRLVARAIVRSTGGFPAGDVALGLRGAVKEIESITGRTLLDKAGDMITPEGMNRTGVDYFLATSSGGRSLRAILVGLMPGVSLESGRHAIEGSYVEVVDTISLRDNRDEEDRVNTMLVSDPDLIFITGGTDGGAVAPLQSILNTVKLAVLSAPEDNRPIVIYAGNSSAIPRVQEAFDDLTQLFIADNVRPDLQEEYLRSAQLRIGQSFDAYKETQGGGFDTVGQMSAIGLLPTAQSYRTITRFLGVADDDVDTLVVVDVGSGSSVLSTYEKGSADESKSQIRTNVGLGHNAPAMVQSIPIEQFRRWIPFSITEADLLNYALNKQLRPGTVPGSRREMYIEHALLRVGIEDMLYSQRPDWRADPPKLDRIIGAGSAVAATGSPGISAMLLMDAVQPIGVTELYADPNALIASMGAISYVLPEAVVQLLRGNNLDYLGTVFSLEGAPRYGERAGRYRIEYEDGEFAEGTITGGAIYILDLPVGRTATVKISGLRRGLRVAGRFNVRRKVRGGLAGVLIDARGRPIPLESPLADRARFITAWYEFVSNVEHPTPPENDLEPVAERYPPQDFTFGQRSDREDENSQSQRRGLFGRRRKPEPKPDPKAASDSVLDELLDEADDLDLDEIEAEMNKDTDLDDLRL
jgi:hypothetical protein